MIFEGINKIEAYAFYSKRLLSLAAKTDDSRMIKVDAHAIGVGVYLIYWNGHRPSA